MRNRGQQWIKLLPEVLAGSQYMHRTQLGVLAAPPLLAGEAAGQHKPLSRCTRVRDLEEALRQPAFTININLEQYRGISSPSRYHEVVPPCSR